MRKTVLIIVSLTLLVSCSKSNKPKSPEAALLIFPEENSECTGGQNISATQSSITFRWNESANTDSFRLSVTDLINNTSQDFTTNANSFTVTLLKGQPYSWSVTSLSDKLPNEQAKSLIWKFYNAGDGIENYAPFPAEIIFPKSGASVSAPNGTVNLQWNATDIDNDIALYQIYLDTNNPPATLIGTNSSSLENFNATSLTPGTIYYWRVITTDATGNTSDSGVFPFQVK